eukprot:8644426-Alexandrium_andersonii.AAC.1
MSASLVGSEMCIRDRVMREPAVHATRAGSGPQKLPADLVRELHSSRACLLYTSDAATICSV